MKRGLLIAVLSFLYISSFGQKIHFSDSTNLWHWYTWSSAIIFTPYYYDDIYLDDTLIYGTNYKILDHDWTTVFIREDTVVRKVFTINSSTPDTDTTEQLLYDYTLNLGDTFRTHHSVHFVSAIDSVLINSIWHKTWHLHGFSTDITGSFLNDYDVIEGIGCVNDPCFPIWPFTFETETDLSCFSNRGTTPPLSHMVGPYFNNITSCSFTFGLSIYNVAAITNAAQLYPNPIDNTSKIVFPYSISSGDLVIINDIGQAVINMPIQNKEEVLIGDKIKVPGIYYYRVTDNLSGQVFSGKILNQ